MRFRKTVITFILILLRFTALADPESDLRDAAGALSRTSYTWETTTRQRFSGENVEPRPNASSALEVQGKFDPNGYTQITLLPSRELAVPATAVFRDGDVVALTPLGWMRRSEIRRAPGPDREVDFEGRRVRLARFFGVALKVTALRPLTEDLFDLIADLKSCRRDEGLIVADLPDRAVEQFWGNAQAKRAREIRGTVTFRITEQGLSEYRVLIATGVVNSRTKKTVWSMQQWSTRITGIGSTSVSPAYEAVQVMEKLP